MQKYRCVCEITLTRVLVFNYFTPLRISPRFMLRVNPMQWAITLFRLYADDEVSNQSSNCKHQNLRPQSTAAVSIKPIYSCDHLGSNSSAHHTHTQARTSVYRLHYTLATCRGFCCSAPPCSLKPHGAPPERETAISSATIPAPSSQPAVYEVCISCSALLQLLTLCAKQ